MDSKDAVSTAETWKFEVKTGDIFWFVPGDNSGTTLVTVGDEGRFYALVRGPEFSFDDPGTIHTIEIPR